MPYPCSSGGYLIATYEKKKGNVATLNLCLVHHEVLVIATVLELFALTAVDTHVLVLRLMEGEERGRVAAVTSIS